MLFGMHPMPADVAVKAGALLDLPPDVVSRLQRAPYRVAEPALLTDPTIYRFHEALTVYGPRDQGAHPRGVRRRDHERDQLQAGRHTPGRP